ncbi:uncharacterized protein EHS24_000581 [Apiotrichum porosum]|uniref:Uncharacterized protein n=1 Tax=Apiotrichum porosum TaxID=105984 RepID=A0A427YAM8_9TREE|nr:uncharacterized protein EHS24_000581 [Apiotrichum porosum]RSH88054.1 hypothetical protein EHS24_000581 [Apiotrichum porosum]
MVAPGAKNLWVAASDGDLERVQALIAAGASPNDKDQHSYTPMHAAASYAHLDLLEFLVGAGGNVNLPDDDGDTPLFTCESVEAAQWLVEHGADAAHKNGEGLTAADSLDEDHPTVAAYLRSVNGAPAPAAPAAEGEGEGVNQLAVDEFAARQTADLMAQSQSIIAEAQRTGTNPDDLLRDLVQRAVREGFSFGGDIGDMAGSGPDVDEEAHKRARGE